MFKTLSSLTKAIVGAAVVTPVSAIADVITLGGALTDKESTYTGDALRDVMQNLKDAAKPDDK